MQWMLQFIGRVNILKRQSTLKQIIKKILWLVFLLICQSCFRFDFAPLGTFLDSYKSWWRSCSNLKNKNNKELWYSPHSYNCGLSSLLPYIYFLSHNRLFILLFCHVSLMLEPWKGKVCLCNVPFALLLLLYEKFNKNLNTKKVHLVNLSSVCCIQSVWMPICAQMNDLVSQNNDLVYENPQYGRKACHTSTCLCLRGKADRRGDRNWQSNVSRMLIT